MTDTETIYTRITFGEAFQRDLVRAATERTDPDGVRRAYHEGTYTYWDVEPADDPDATAQDIIDALRFVLMAQDDDKEAAKLTRALLEFAPETNNDRGIKLLLQMIAEGSLKVGLVGDV